MKNLMTIFGTILIASTILTSCNTVQVAKFASIDNVMDLQTNITLDQVIAKLGSKPYNVYSNQKDGYAIYTYKYKVIERKVNPKFVNKRGGETTGTEVYNGKEHTLFLLFKEGKLESLVTTDGRKDSNPLILLNNTLYTISADKGNYILVPTTTEESNSGAGLIFGKKKK